MLRRWWPWAVVVLFFSIGALLVATGAQLTTSEQTYRSARECADTASPSCYQLYPGAITGVRVTQTSSGERDEVVIRSRGTNINVSLEPSPSQARLVSAGTTVSVEWYSGEVTAVRVGGESIPSINNPAANHPELAYYGWMLVWAAGAFAVAGLVGWMLARRREQPPDSESGAVEQVLPNGGVGWVAAPRPTAATLIPLVVGGAALVSITPFFIPDRRLPALAFDALLFAAAAIRLALFVHNSRIMADTSSLLKVDSVGRFRNWPLAEVVGAFRFSAHGLYSDRRRVLFIGADGKPLFRVSHPFWDYDQLDAVCRGAGIRLAGDYATVLADRTSKWLSGSVAVGVTLAGVVLGFLLFPGSGGP